jgi:hypothetical protein
VRATAPIEVARSMEPFSLMSSGYPGVFGL